MKETPISRDDLLEKYKKIIADENSKWEMGVKEKKLKRILDNAWMAHNKFMKIYNQWKNGELPGKSLISEFHPVIKQLEEDAKIIEQLDKDIRLFEGEQIDKSYYGYPSMIETGPEIMNKFVNRLRAAVEEIEKEQPITPDNNGILCEKLLFDKFSVFQKHSEYLKKNGYYEVDKNNLRWIHGGNLLLAVYFGKIQEKPGNPRLMWADIEKAFNTRNLASYYSDYEPLNRGKTAKYEKYEKELKKLVDGTISL